MKKIIFLKTLLVIFILFPLFTSGYQPAPVDFEFNSEGEVFGTLEDGSEFSQTNIYSSPRIQKFTWRGGSWYVSDKGIIEASSDLEALLIHINS